MIVCLVLIWSLAYYAIVTGWQISVIGILMIIPFILIIVFYIPYMIKVGGAQYKIKERILSDPRSSNFIDFYPVRADKVRPSTMRWRLIPWHYTGYIFAKRNGLRLIARNLINDAEIDWTIEPGTRIEYESTMLDNYLVGECGSGKVYFSRTPHSILGTKQRNHEILEIIRKINKFRVMI